MCKDHKTEEAAMWCRVCWQRDSDGRSDPSGFIFRSLSLDLIQAPQGLADKPPEDPPQSSEQTKTPVWPRTGNWFSVSAPAEFHVVLTDELSLVAVCLDFALQNPKKAWKITKTNLIYSILLCDWYLKCVFLIRFCAAKQIN